MTWDTFWHGYFDLCTVVGAIALLVALTWGVTNAAVWLWTRFLEAAGAAFHAKDMRDCAKAADQARRDRYREQVVNAADAARARLMFAGTGMVDELARQDQEARVF